MEDEHWRAHEHHHFHQEKVDFGGSTFRYLTSFCWQYVQYRSHDLAPLEQEAEEAARQFIAKKQAERESAGTLDS